MTRANVLFPSDSPELYPHRSSLEPHSDICAVPHCTTTFKQYKEVENRISIIVMNSSAVLVLSLAWLGVAAMSQCCQVGPYLRTWVCIFRKNLIARIDLSRNDLNAEVNLVFRRIRKWKSKDGTNINCVNGFFHVTISLLNMRMELSCACFVRIMIQRSVFLYDYGKLGLY